MKLRPLVATTVTAALAGALAVGPPAAATGSHGELGTRSLATVLASDGDTFDHNPRDYDILDQAVGAVLAANPDSAVAVLADGTVPLTAFLPNDFSFKVLTYDLTGRWYHQESAALAALAEAVGIEAVESVLLYHVVPGVTIDAKTALRSDGAVLETALDGATFEVDVRSRYYPIIRLRDADTDDVDPVLDPRALNINKGNRQIAHGIVFVLRPLDL